MTGLLVAISLAGALIRVYFVARHKGKTSPVPIVVAGIILILVAAAIAPKSRAATTETVTLAMIRPVIESRCTTCHSQHPTHIAFPAAPSGVVLDTDEEINTEAQRIHQQTVVLKVMPIGNLTQISEEERDLIDAWYQGRLQQE